MCVYADEGLGGDGVGKDEGVWETAKRRGGQFGWGSVDEQVWERQGKEMVARGRRIGG